MTTRRMAKLSDAVSGGLFATTLSEPAESEPEQQRFGFGY